MKVALCLSGHLRAFERTGPTIMEMIAEPTGCDIFISTWDKMGVNYDEGRIEEETELYRPLIEAVFNPTLLHIEPSRQFDSTKYKDNHGCHFTPSNALSMFYKIEHANSLKKEYEEAKGFVYDAVIRCRPDIECFDQICLEDLARTDSVWTPKFAHWGGVNDQFAFSNSKNMDWMTSLYSHIDDYFDTGTPLHPESLMKRHVEAGRLHIRHTNFRYDLIRATGASLRQW